MTETYEIMEGESPMTDRFWSKIDIRGNDDCWPWMAAKDHKGYGRFSLARRNCRAHRIAFMRCVANIPKVNHSHEAVVMHSCDNPSCCNPNHLFLGTQADNVNDMIVKGRKALANGEDVPAARLTSKDVTDIRADTRSNSAVSREYGVTPQAIYHIRTRKSWRHLP